MADFDGTTFMEVAQTLARRTEANYRRAAIGRAYYSLFWAARERVRLAKVPIRGLSRSIAGGSHAVLIEVYRTKTTRDGSRDEAAFQFAETLEELHGVRCAADYDADNDLGVEDRRTVDRVIEQVELATIQLGSINWPKPR